MQHDDPALQAVVDQVREAASREAPLRIAGGDSKAFYGNPVEGTLLDTRPLAGISSYEPSELVITVRAGTPLAEVEAVLAERGQCLAFEPPRFGAGGTVGGMVAAGLSGPARATAGGVRDHVLGASLLNGRGEVLSFGGQVMKNVAGYDVSRLLAGSLGTLGVILEVSLKVLPRPAASASLCFAMGQADALDCVNRWAGEPLPLSASAWFEGRLWLRLAGAQAAVRSAIATLGGERLDDREAEAFWTSLRDQQHAFFAGLPLWRLSVAATTPPLALPGESLIEWGGAQRWLISTEPARRIRDAARAAGGHATLFRGSVPGVAAFDAVSPPLARIHRQLMTSFDPQHLFNRGRLYPSD